MEMENDSVNEVLNIASLWATYEHGPIMREAIGRGILPDEGFMAKLKFNLDRLKEGEKNTRININ